MTQAIKCHPPFFAAIVSGEKTFEVRKNDRNYKSGDKLLIQEYHPENGYTGKEWEGIITYLLDHPDYCKKGFVVFGIKPKQENY